MGELWETHLRKTNKGKIVPRVPQKARINESATLVPRDRATRRHQSV